MSKRPAVVVVGSLNVDYIASVQHLPASGETIAATNLIRRLGGKGANQAIAAARRGAAVSMIGCIGADDEGRAYLQRLHKKGIDADGISTTSKALTGTALIAVDAQAENMIIVAAGANGFVSPASIRRERRRIESAAILLLQQEVPMKAVIEAVRIANRAAVPVILNPSPLTDGFPWGNFDIDTLVVNAGEAQSIFRISAENIFTSLPRWRRALATRSIERLIITRGSNSTVYLDQAKHCEIPTFRVKPKDTVGAGDAFAGTLAARRAEGAEILSAIRYANCAGALTTLLPGAQEAIPNRRQTEKANQTLR